MGILLSIKPILYVSNDGKLVVASKVRARKAAMRDILEKMKVDFTEPDGKEVFINHADCLDDAELMGQMIRSPSHGIKITIMSLGAVIAPTVAPDF